MNQNKETFMKKDEKYFSHVKKQADLKKIE